MESAISSTRSRQAIDAAVEAFLKVELARHKPERIEFLLSTNPTALDDWKATKREDLTTFAQSVLAVDNEFVKRYRQGNLHPCNKISRKLFEGLTGLKLPDTVSGTESVVRQYCGGALEAYDAAVKAARDEAERQEAHKAESERLERLATLSRAVRDGEPIDGEGFVDLAEANGITFSPATKGMIRRRVARLSIEGDNVRVASYQTKSKSPLPPVVWSEFRRLYATLTST